MKRKRIIIYSLLALPLVIFTIFFFTLDPIARGTFFREFKVKLAAQFGFEDTNDIQLTDVAPEMAQAGGGGGGGAPAGDNEIGGDADDTDGAPEGDEDGGAADGGGPGGGGPGRGGPGGGGRGGGDPAAFFASQDADGDGNLTGDEIPGRMRDNLDRIDADGDGSVTLEEFQAARRNRGGGGGGRGGPGAGGGGRGGPGGGRGGGGGGGRPSLEENFATQDANGDGKITEEEMSARMRDNLEQIDADGNGSITLEELRTYVSQRGGNRGGGRGGRGGRGGGGGGGSGEDRPDRPARPE